MRTLFIRGASTGLLLLAGANVSAVTVNTQPVNLQVCSGEACWNGNYEIPNNQVVDWTNVEAKPNSNNRSVNDWEADKGMDLSNWSLSMDSDPFITNNFFITNTSNATQTYTITTSIGITPVIPNALMRGSIGFSLTDNNGGGATLATSGASIFRGLIDSSTARTLWDVPTSFSVPGPGPTTTGTTSFGYPLMEVAPQSIDTDIGIIIRFSLTAGDSAAFTSNFEVTAVPVPAAAWLFASGLFAMLGVARRKPV